MIKIPIDELKNTKKIEQLCYENKDPIYLTKDGKNTLVIMDIEHFKELLSQLEEASNVNEALINSNEENILDGKIVLGELRTKYDF